MAVATLAAGGRFSKEPACPPAGFAASPLTRQPQARAMAAAIFANGAVLDDTRRERRSDRDQG